jgi:hypothetical protein
MFYCCSYSIDLFDDKIQEKTKHIASIQLGQVDIDCWFHSPYIDVDENSPDKDRTIDKLYICEHCLLYFLNNRKYQQHTVINDID